MNAPPTNLNILRHDMRGCINAIQLNVLALKLTGDKAEAATFLDCIETELAKVDVLLGQLMPTPGERAAA
jgi:hypothetical protein